MWANTGLGGGYREKKKISADLGRSAGKERGQHEQMVAKPGARDHLYR
jgi:hypothetical protein